MTDLERRVRECRDAYYNGHSLITDAEFDRLMDELRRESPSSPVLAEVGAPAGSRFPRARHLIPMGSQNAATGEEEFLRWAAKVSPASYVVQYKLDGASLELQYVRGKLAKAVTRGDGETGNVITDNARRMKGVLPELPSSFSGGVRGEVIMTREVWNEKYSERQSRRDTANGIMLRKNGSGCEDLSFIAYDAGEAGNDGFFTGELEKIAWLNGQGFETVNTEVFTCPRRIAAYHENTAKERPSLPVDIDGLVVKDGKTDAADLRRGAPERQIAFKFRMGRLA